MKRRSLLAVAFGTIGSGCLSGESELNAMIDHIRIENHRYDDSYDITVEISESDEAIFKETRTVSKAGSEGNYSDIVSPVSGPGQYSIRAASDDDYAHVHTKYAISEGEKCLYVKFVLGEVLHYERRAHPCDWSRATN